MSEFYRSLGRRIKHRRRMLYLRQRDVATVVGVTMQQIQKYEYGLNRISLEHYLKLCVALDCDLDQLVSEALTEKPIAINPRKISP